MPDSSVAPNSADHVLDDVQIEVSICLGHMQVRMDDLSRLSVDDVLTTNSSLDDPILLYIGRRLIAEGVLEEISQNSTEALGVRITQVLTGIEA